MITKFETSKNIPKSITTQPVLSMETVVALQPKDGHETELLGVTAFMFDERQIGIAGLVFGAPCQQAMSKNAPHETNITIGIQRNGVYMTDLMTFEGCKMKIRMLSPGDDSPLELYMWGPYDRYSSQSGQADESSSEIPPSGVASIEQLTKTYNECASSHRLEGSSEKRRTWPWTRIQNALRAIASSIEDAKNVIQNHSINSKSIPPAERLLQFMERDRRC